MNRATGRINELAAHPHLQQSKYWHVTLNTLNPGLRLTFRPSTLSTVARSMSKLPVSIGRFNDVFTCAVNPDHGSTVPV